MSFKCLLGMHTWDGYKCTQCGKEKSFFTFPLLLDGQEYRCAKIGRQIWMQTNLDAVSFRNGDRIPEAKTNEEWEQAGRKGKSAWCYYDNNPENGNKYGKLYNWYAVNDPRGLAPKGWHIPTVKEWTTLTESLGGFRKAADKMKSTSGWDEEGNIIAGNQDGFAGLPGGTREKESVFGSIGSFTAWWSASPDDTQVTIMCLKDIALPLSSEKSCGYSVRCLMD